MAKKSSHRAAFMEWLAKQPPESEFDFNDPTNCCYGQFLQDTGRALEPNVGYESWFDRLKPSRGDIPKEIAKTLLEVRDALYPEGARDIGSHQPIPYGDIQVELAKFD